MKIVRARRGGFCMGVALALHKLDAIVDDRPLNTVATLGEIIHNPQVLEDYARRGVRCLQSPDEAGPEMSVLIRAHGVPRDMEATLRRRCSHVEDATCPRVKKAQLAIAHATATGCELLLYGEESHPEVQGLISYAVGPRHIFSSLEELEPLLQSLALRGRPVVLAAQTTQDRLMFDQICQKVLSVFGDSLEVLDTICDATRERQKEAVDLAGQVQAMVVVGGRTSGNTRRLAGLTRSCGVPTVLVETPDELDPRDFQGVEIIGLTAGASTPSSIIDAAELRLKSW